MSHALSRECLVIPLAEIEAEVFQAGEAGEGVGPELAGFGGGELGGQTEVQLAEAGQFPDFGEQPTDKLGVEDYVFEVQFEGLEGWPMAQKAEEIGFMDADLFDSVQRTRWGRGTARRGGGQCGPAAGASPSVRGRPRC